MNISYRYGIGLSVSQQTPTPPLSWALKGSCPRNKDVLNFLVIKKIYALGALMVAFFTGFSPVKIDCLNEKDISTHLLHFTDNSALTILIQKCLSLHPATA